MPNALAVAPNTLIPEMKCGVCGCRSDGGICQNYGCEGILAPNTPCKQIRREGPYHWVGPGTVMGVGYQPALCLKCRKVANPAHVCDGPKEGLLVYCAAHCVKCLRYRQDLKNEERERAAGE